jgi:hypothetical protein
LRGISIDSPARLTALAASVRALRSVPAVRLVLDPGTTPGTYSPAINRLRPAAYVMAELVDSEAMQGLSPREAARAALARRSRTKSISGKSATR